jgi:hypothetical protein
MTYMRFSPTGRSKWDVFAPVKSTKPIATVTRCSVTINRALNREELDSLSAFMRERSAN